MDDLLKLGLVFLALIVVFRLLNKENTTVVQSSLPMLSTVAGDEEYEIVRDDQGRISRIIVHTINAGY